MINLDDIISQIKTYKSNFNQDLITRGHDFCILAHKGQFRKSGHPYHVHPITVAFELSKLKLDEEAIVAGFLHDVIEDTPYDKQYISANFSSNIAELVDGVTKLKQVNTNIDEIKQVENLRKMFLYVSRDIRVLLIKICDRLDNMRSIEHHANQQKIRQIAKETIEIHAPLAERLGLISISEELQDICFKILNPEARSLIIETIKKIKNTHIKDIINFISKKLEMLLFEYGVDGVVLGREKTPYSIWRKIQTQNIKIQDLTDITGFRIITNDTASCYTVLGILHTHYKAIQYKFFDYISTPKPNNNYQSIHTAVIDNYANKIEIQIRNKKMHEEATLGVAAHWSYKQNVTYKPTKEYGFFIKELNNIFQNHNNASEILNQTRNEIFFEKIFVFTAKSDVIELPSGAVALDFAFHVHTQVGLNAKSAIINGKASNLDRVLNNGDIIEIDIDKSLEYNISEALKIVTTNKAKNILRKTEKETQKQQNLKNAKEILKIYSEKLNLEEDDIVKIIYKKTDYKDSKSLFKDIELGKVDISKYTQNIETEGLSIKNKDHSKVDLLTYSCQNCNNKKPFTKEHTSFISNIGIMYHHDKDCEYFKSNPAKL